MSERSLLIGAVCSEKSRLKNDGMAMVEVSDNIGSDIKKNDLFANAPFKAISLILRYGSKQGEPIIGKLDKKNFELQIAIELPLMELRELDQKELTARFHSATIDCIIAALEHYKLPFKSFNNKK